MRLFFWDFSDENDTARQWIMFIFNIFVFIFVLRAVTKTITHYRRCIFELVPLSVNLFATFILLLLKLFEKGYEYDEIGHLIQIFTYFLFCHTFALMYSRIMPSRYSETRKRVWNVILIIFFLAVIVLSFLIFSGTISNKCSDKDTQQLPTMISLIFQFISFIPTSFYGMKILKSMKQKEKQSNLQDMTGSTIGLLSKQQYIEERRKQIMLVLGAYFFSLVLRLFITIFSILYYESLFDCQEVQKGVFIISGNVWGQLILVLAEFDKLLPHIVIPIAMYVIPLRKIDSTLIKLGSHADNFIEEDFEKQNKKQHNQNEISSVLSSRLSSGKKSRI